MKALIILNDPPYGTERCYNVLRLARALLKNDPQTEVTIFLMADAVVAVRKGQKTPDGYYNAKARDRRQRHRPALRHLHGCAWHDRRRYRGRRAAKQHGRACRGHRGRRQGAGVLSDDEDLSGL